MRELNYQLPFFGRDEQDVFVNTLPTFSTFLGLTDVVLPPTSSGNVALICYVACSIPHEEIFLEYLVTLVFLVSRK